MSGCPRSDLHVQVARNYSRVRPSVEVQAEHVDEPITINDRLTAEHCGHEFTV